jgi:hypothetical protein
LDWGARYPSTQHLPFSPGLGDGDTRLPSGECAALLAEETVLTEKLDGSNCCIARGVVYARTHKHPTRLPWFSTVKQLHHVLAWTTSEGEGAGLELFGENMTATHSIAYPNLTSYFVRLAFGFFTHSMLTCLSVAPGL